MANYIKQKLKALKLNKSEVVTIIVYYKIQKLYKFL
jgi:hypothetical protein